MILSVQAPKNHKMMLTPDDKSPSIDWLPWARFNLHRNPFGELTPDERAELAVVNVDYLVEMLGDPRQAVQFIGECGRGKTTRTHPVRQLFQGVPFWLMKRSGCLDPLGAVFCAVSLRWCLLRTTI